MAVNRLGPPCPKCGHEITSVTTTARSREAGFYRRRLCLSCGHRFTTAQLAEVPIGSHVFTWDARRLSRIEWQHPDLLWQLQSLITGERPERLQQGRGGRVA
jgi:hypothetical protein